MSLYVFPLIMVEAGKIANLVVKDINIPLITVVIPSIIETNDFLISKVLLFCSETTDLYKFFAQKIFNMMNPIIKIKSNNMKKLQLLAIKVKIIAYNTAITPVNPHVNGAKQYENKLTALQLSESANNKQCAKILFTKRTKNETNPIIASAGILYATPIIARFKIPKINNIELIDNRDFFSDRFFDNQDHTENDIAEISSNTDKYPDSNVAGTAEILMNFVIPYADVIIAITGRNNSVSEDLQLSLFDFNIAKSGKENPAKTIRYIKLLKSLFFASICK